MIHIIFILGAILLIVYLLYKLGTKNYDVFEKQGLKFLKPLPFLGSTLDTFKGNGIADRILNTCRLFPGEKVIGQFEMTNPIFIIRCPDVIRQISIKDFHYFQDRMPFVDESIDEYFGKMLFSLSGKEWRDMRTTLSPMFTGNKMRMMLTLIVKCSSQLVEFLQDEYKKKGLTPRGIRDIFSRIANDAIASCAFGVECDSLKNRDNEIYKIGQDLLQLQKSFTIFKFMMMRYLPKIAKLFGIVAIESDKRQKFTDLILGTMNIRKREGIVRPDLLQMVMKIRDGQAASLREDDKQETEKDLNELKGDEKRTWTDTDLLAQTFVFYAGGLDTTSTAMTYGAYELALNPDIQERLFEEIVETNESLGNKPLNYETLHKMKYLDMVISEMLRKWTPAVATDRLCNKDYLYEDNDGLKFVIKKGSLICIPIYGFHMDSNIFPDPEKFDPDRFNDENKASRDSVVYMPFGVGPRNCIASRLALMMMKTVFFYLVLNCKIKVCNETDIPLKFKNSVLGLVPTKEIKLYIEPRV